MKENNQEKFEFNTITVTPSGCVVSDIVDRKTNKEWINWGYDNQMPKLLFDNYMKCSNLQSIVQSVTDYIIGDGIESDFSNTGIDFEDEVKKMVFDYVLFGGFSFECIRNKMGSIAFIRYINIMNVRVNEDLTTAYISPKWNQYSAKDMVTLPLFDGTDKQPHFIYFYRGTITRGINPIPIYISALKSIEILNQTREFHMQNLKNGFSASVLISFNDGIIKKKELEDIRLKLEDNYQGATNAGKVILVTSTDKEHAPTIERLAGDNFKDQYFALQESSINDLFTAFRINPVLLGNNFASGFQAIEYQNIFELYYKTVIKPMQNNIIKVFNHIGVNVNFKKFNLEFAD